MNRKDLNRIRKFEIFLYKDGQLRTAHVILRYTPIMTCFQSLKHVIKSKDPCIVRIEVTIPGFLTSPPSKGTFEVELTAQ